MDALSTISDDNDSITSSDTKIQYIRSQIHMISYDILYVIWLNFNHMYFGQNIDQCIPHAN